MNETASSCLAITEKRSHNHRPGGCVGIFFQLFDWNRRFAKKKLFSKKLLPPARAKQASKKFGGDEKMPKTKLHLIADENSGGFPNSKKNRSSSSSTMNSEQKHEMRAPSLVARLMGLESMPTNARDKHKKAILSDRCDDREEKFVGNSKDLNLEKGSETHESRPQKLQKTGSIESLEVTKFGGEAFQIKNVLSLSRKQHHSKLASPVRSPRFPSGKSSSRTSRLIDVATKILDPGLQNTNRAKCPITYSNSLHYPPKHEVKTDGTCDMSSELSNQSVYNACGANSSNGQSCKNCGKSCKNCDSELDVVHCRSNEEEMPYVFASSASNFANASSKASGICKSKTTMSSLEQDSELVLRKNQDQSLPLACQVKNNIQTQGVTCRDGSRVSQQRRWPSSGQPCQLQKDEPSSTALKATQTQNQMSLVQEKISFRARQSNLESRRVSSAANAVNGEKDYVSLNRSLSGRTRPRVPFKGEHSTLDTERKSCNRQDYTLSKLRTPVRKRTIVNGQAESTDYICSTSGKQRNIRCSLTGKEGRRNVNTPSLDRSCVKNRSVREKADNSKNSDVISFTFSSPLRQKPLISKELEENIRNQDDFVTKSTSPRRELILDENDGKTPLWKTLPFNGDALGALLEQKLKELAQEEDELVTGGTLPERSTALILQELISALTAEQLVLPDVHRFGRDNQATVKTEGTSLEFLRVDHLSPGSVLEASFSNASCLSSSLDDSSGPKLVSDSMDYSYDQLPQLKPDVDLFDSATSLKKSCHEILTDLVDYISMVFQSPNLACPALMGSKLAHAKEVILNTELLFGYTSRQNSYGIIGFLMDPFFLQELENAAAAACLIYVHGPSFDETKEGQLWGFLLDIFIECLDTKYGRYSYWGYKNWRRLPLSVTAEFMIQDVDNEIRKWMHLAGKIPDEIIEWEMSHSLGKWTDFDSEAYETGAEIDRDIFQVLVEEIFSDFC